MSRKDDHVHYALKQHDQPNDFDKVRFVHNSLPNIALDDIDMTTTLGPFKLPVPLMINAMTGGSEKTKIINGKLAILAQRLSLPIATGSLSSALKDKSLESSYTIVKKQNPHGLVFANIGAGSNLKKAQAAVDLLEADALQIHLNAPQEIVMPEGDRTFKTWSKDITNAINYLSVPLIVKEVGFGMSKETLKTLKTCGVSMIDISGKGGTNFITIENNRRDNPLSYLDDYGLSTVESLLEAQTISDIDIIASGGIRNPLDAIKAFSLGAKAVGLSGYFLKLINNNDIETAITKTQDFIDEMKKIMTILGTKTLKDLTHLPKLYDVTLINYIAQRNLILQ